MKEERDFFSKNKDSLEKGYPGITLEHFLRFCEENPLTAKIKEKLLCFVPLEYISGKAYFFQDEFVITPDVLIPRSETEILVELAIGKIEKAHLGKNRPLRILEIGTGSGCLILSILAGMPKNKQSQKIEAYATDISSKAILVAKENEKRLRENQRISANEEVTFLESNLFRNLFDLNDKIRPSTFDLVVSNPPYIPQEKKEVCPIGVHQQVFDYEPHQALFLPKDENDKWFQEFFLGANEFLLPGGILLMEGHEQKFTEYDFIARESGFTNVRIHQDYTHRHRFLEALKSL